MVKIWCNYGFESLNLFGNKIWSHTKLGGLNEHVIVNQKFRGGGNIWMAKICVKTIFSEVEKSYSWSMDIGQL